MHRIAGLSVRIQSTLPSFPYRVRTNLLVILVSRVPCRVHPRIWVARPSRGAKRRPDGTLHERE